MTLGPDVIAAAIAALNIYALAELLCPHADTTIDTAGRQLRSDIDLWIGAVLAVSLVLLGAPHLLTAGLHSEAFAGLIGGSQHHKQLISDSKGMESQWNSPPPPPPPPR